MKMYKLCRLGVLVFAVPLLGMGVYANSRVSPSDATTSSREVHLDVHSKADGHLNAVDEPTRFIAVEKTKSTPNDRPTSSIRVKRGAKLVDDEGGWACFRDCVAESVPLDVVLECASSCGQKQWTTCATCLGVGIYVVATCAYNCYDLEAE